MEDLSVEEETLEEDSADDLERPDDELEDELRELTMTSGRFHFDRTSK